MRVIISGGGSGGHIFPALAIAEALKKRIPDVEIQFVGAKGKIEMEKVPKAGYPIEGLWISGIDRKLTKRNLIFPFKLVSSLWKARKIIKAFKPEVVIGVGGYASGPVLHVASGMGIPTLIQEQNSYAGITNKLLAKRVDKICVAYPKMERFFPAEKLTFTGNPVRKSVYDHNLSVEDARKKCGVDADQQTVLLFGGSLGARTLNVAMRENTAAIEKMSNVNFIWQCGKIYYDDYKNSDTAGLSHVHCSAFIDDMAAAYRASDIVVCRAGALTISELALTEKPAILVPSPNVAEDHQTKNAMALVERDAALLVTDTTLKEELIPSIVSMLGDEEKKNRMAQAIRALGKEDAADSIASEIIDMIKPS